MTVLLNRSTSYRPLAAALSALMLAMITPASAGPGAHGPNGEHLDGPAAIRSIAALPRVEATSETFELVAELRGGELVILVDRYDSNEPVLDATLEVESGALKASAAFRVEQGDYVVTDVAMLQALTTPGEHGLVFMLVAGNDSDLLDGTLVTAARGRLAGAAGTDHGHDDPWHDHELERAAWIGSGVAALGLIGSIALRHRRRRDVAKPLEGL